jgi:hypothetical protein
MFDRRGNALEILHRPQADVKIELLAQFDVEGADAPADGRGQRPFDADQKFLEGLDGFLRQPGVEFFEGLLAREDLEPGNLAFAAVSLVDGRVEHPLAGGPNIRPGAVAADERDDGMIGHTSLPWAMEILPPAGGVMFL